ncbi:uncharacterized protein LOC144858990 isoform X2 [Branchiostoma floridae x Branchiostoma japonicum]
MADGPLLSLDLLRCFPPVRDKVSARLLWLTRNPDFGRGPETDLRGRVLGGGRGAGGGEIGGGVGTDQNSKTTRRVQDQGPDIRREKQSLTLSSITSTAWQSTRGKDWNQQP